ncbi:MAG: addiction module protein [Pirellulaceae bacterium]
MDIEQAINELSTLPVVERLHLIHSLWDSIPPTAPIELTPAQRQEIQRRIAEHEADPSTALTREQLDELLGRKQ